MIGKVSATGISTADRMVNLHCKAAIITDFSCRLSLVTAIAWNNLRSYSNSLPLARSPNQE
jgi:hypothetical protein